MQNQEKGIGRTLGSEASSRGVSGAVKRSASALSGILAIETLANIPEVDASVFIDLIERNPQISNNEGKYAREMVSLRVLESFLALRNRVTSDDSSSLHPTIHFDPSNNCEDVLRRILWELSPSTSKRIGPELLKLDIQPFIMHKRACLPKCVLQQLKDAIIEGSNPIFASFKDTSGLAVRNRSENRMHVDDANLNAVAGRPETSGNNGQILLPEENLISSTIGNQNGLLQDVLTEKDLLPSERENLEAQFSDEQIIVDIGHLHDAKKFKRDVSCTTTAVIQKSVLHENRVSEDLPGIVGQQTRSQGIGFAEASQVGNSVGSCFSEDGDDEQTALQRMSWSNGANDDDVLHNHLQISEDDNKMTGDTSADEPHQNVSGGEAKDDNEQCAQIAASNGAPQHVTVHNFSIDEGRGNCEHDSQPDTSNGASSVGYLWKNFVDKMKDDMEYNHESEMSSDSGESHDDIDVSMKKHIFLTSQCSFSQDSLAIADCTERKICMKCQKDGQLLTCSVSTCTLVVHESCLGSAANFDDGGNFYCPFCFYSCAIAEYMKLKEVSSLARKDLHAFIGDMDAKLHAFIGDMDAFIGLRDAHGLKEPFMGSRSEQSQLRRDEDVTGNNETNSGNNEKKVGNSQSRVNVGDEPHAERSTSCLDDIRPRGEEAATVISGTPSLIVKDNREGEKMGQECRDTETVHMSGSHSEVGVQQDVLQQLSSDPPPEAACTTKVTTAEDDDKSVAFQNTYEAIHQSRRKKVWTPIEEEKLREGVQIYSKNNRNIPWKKILEFGVDVFQKGRTAADLKDKWRNMCRSPKLT